MMGILISLRLIVLISAFAPVAFARCQWTVLRDGSDSYIASQQTGELDPSFASVTIQENGKKVDFKNSLLSKNLTIDNTHTIIDQTDCKTYTEVIVTDPKDPYVIGTQITYKDKGNVNSGAVEPASIDSVITTIGDYQFDANKTLGYVLKEDWITIEQAERSTREDIEAAADAYLDLWSNPTAKVNWGTRCQRLEGSVYTNTCNEGLPAGDKEANTNRRYVIDETVGAISVLCSFGSMKNAPDSHEFRFEGGKLRYVHVMRVLRS